MNGTCTAAIPSVVAAASGMASVFLLSFYDSYILTLVICARFIFFISEEMDSNWLEESWYVQTECLSIRIELSVLL